MPLGARRGGKRLPVCRGFGIPGARLGRVRRR